MSPVHLARHHTSSAFLRVRLGGHAPAERLKAHAAHRVGRKRSHAVCGSAEVLEGQHPAADPRHVVDLGAGARVGDDFGPGARYQPGHTLHLPLGVHEEAELAEHQVLRMADTSSSDRGTGEGQRFEVGTDSAAQFTAGVRAGR